MPSQLDTHLQQAIHAFQNNSLKESESVLENVLRLDNKNLVALQILGLIKASQMKYDDAAKYLKDAVEISPNNASINYNLAKVLMDAERDTESIPHHHRAVELDPKNPQSWLNFGKALFKLNEFDNALTKFTKATELNKNYFDAILNLGITLLKLNQYKDALFHFDQGLTLKPDSAECFFYKAQSFFELKQYSESLGCIDIVLRLQPNHPSALSKKALLLHKVKRFDEALNLCDYLLKLNLINDDVLNTQGLIFHDLKLFNQAINSFNQALEINSDRYDLYNNKGLAFRSMQSYEEAIVCFDSAQKLNPEAPEVLLNKGLVYFDLKLIDQALTFYNAAINLNPNYYEALFNKGVALLLKNHCTEGFKLYENRLHLNFHFDNLDLLEFDSKPKWDGTQLLTGRTIFIRYEQGFGDAIQFYRFVKEIENRGGRAILELPRQLINLFDATSTLQIIEMGTAPPLFDYHIPLLSLPAALGTNLNTIPNHSPYIFSNSDKVNYWKAKLGLKEKKRIGIVWSSMSNFKDDSKRSLSLANFSKSLPRHDFEYICLQKEIKESDKEFFYNNNFIRFFGDELNDFSDTAALIECMDLVISTCTSVPHLSASLGKQTWVLLSYVPDWRWLLDRQDSPWYPSVKLYRQKALNDWDSVFAAVKFDLSAIAD